MSRKFHCLRYFIKIYPLVPERCGRIIELIGGTLGVLQCCASKATFLCLELRIQWSLLGCPASGYYLIWMDGGVGRATLLPRMSHNSFILEFEYEYSTPTWMSKSFRTKTSFIIRIPSSIIVGTLNRIMLCIFTGVKILVDYLEGNAVIIDNVVYSYHAKYQNFGCRYSQLRCSAFS